MPTIDFSYVGAVDGFRHVATLDLDTFAITNISAPSPGLRGADVSLGGCKLPDGRYVFPATGTPTVSLNLLLHVLSADRSTWTVVDTGLDVGVYGFNETWPIARPTDGKVMLVYWRGPFDFFAQLVDADTGLPSGAELSYPYGVDDETQFEAPSLIDGTSIALVTTESRFISGLDLVSGARSTLADFGTTFDLDFTAAAYHAGRGSIFAWGIGFFINNRVCEFAYPGGGLLNTWLTSGAWENFNANGVIADPYYAFASASTHITRFDIATGDFLSVPLDVSGSDFLVIPNSGVSNQVPLPGKLRRVQARDIVRFEGH